MSISPLLALPGAVAAAGADSVVAAHYGSFNTEQRALATGEGFVDLSHRDVVVIAGPDRLGLLHSLTTQAFEGLTPGVWTAALVLSPQGHVEHYFHGVDDGTAFTAWTEPGHGAGLVEFLEKMKFWSDVTPRVAEDLAVVWRPALTESETDPGRYSFVPRASLEAFAVAAGPAAGLWAFEALRIARGEPRFGVDTDHRTIPNEVGWLPGVPVPAVHLDKGCYRGQETVARVHTLGKPPRRLALLHLDGSENSLPEVGSPVFLATDVLVGVSPVALDEGALGRHAARAIGFVGSSARHHELGPIALALLKRSAPIDAVLSVDGMPAAQEVLVDPDAGLHVRPLR